MFISDSKIEENSLIPMERPYRIIRRSIHTFLQHYQYFTFTAALLAFPFSASVLLSQTVVPSSSLLFTIHNRLLSLFSAAGFPPSSEFFSFLNLKLSQSISSSIFSLPFTLSSLLIAKACIIQSLHHHKPSLPLSFSSVISLYSPLLVTCIYNSLVILSANATAFCLLVFGFNCIEGLGFTSPNCLLVFSASAAVVYSIFLANALVICNLALVSSGMEKCGGYMAILKACVMIQGKTSTALTLAVPVNLVLAAVEALFQYRIVRAYNLSEKFTSSMAMEGLFIAYLYSIFIVLDTVVSCIFFKSCTTNCLFDHEGRYYCSIDIEDEKSTDLAKNFKILEELP